MSRDRHAEHVRGGVHRERRADVSQADPHVGPATSPADAASSQRPATPIERVERRYAPGAERPLRGYLGTLAVYSVVVGGLAALVQRRGGPVERLHERDVVTGAIATFHLARLLGEASVTSPVRAPFTRYLGPGAPGETAEEVQEPRGGLRHSVGELVTCPYCLGTWLATGFGFGMVLAPRWTRFIGSVLTMNAGSNLLQKLYADLQAR